MEINTKKLQQQYQGFLNTNLLWKNTFYGLQQLDLLRINTRVYNGNLTENPRLGKRVESFVSCYLEQFESIKIVHENIQIQKENRTIGEIDCVLFQDNTPTHLEVVFKFYLYNNSVGNSEIEHWIGPNRNDSLQQKLEKLSTKQLPLLFREETQKYLDIDVSKTQQKVFFKAQLFVPYANQNTVFEQLNSDCVTGFYINQQQLEQFNTAKFYIPTKMDWLLEPHKQVDWFSFETFNKTTSELLAQNKSPLCWMKQQNGEISKFFLVWWEL